MKIKRVKKMQNDLISRSALLEHLDNGAISFQMPMPASHVDTVKKVLDALFEQLSKTIKEQPTAYDVDKVVEQLEDMSGIQFDGNNESYQLDWCIELNRAIEIVRNGGRM